MIRLLMFLILSLALAGCGLFGAADDKVTARAPGLESRVGATAFSGAPGDSDEGVGGTGISIGDAKGNDPDEGVGGTGIYGTITSFGSIVVNGVHIDYGPATPVRIDGGPGTPDDFSIGQIVSVDAAPNGSRYEARLVEVQHAVIGPVGAVDDAAGTFQVLGQEVTVVPGFALPVQGTWVKVSGLRDAGERIVASRIDPAAPDQGALLRGVVLATEGELPAIGLLRLEEAEPDAGLGLVAAGDEVLVRGRIVAGRFAVTRVVKEPAIPFGGRMQDLLIEGYVASSSDGNAYLAGHSWAVPQASRAGGRAMLFRGAWGAGTMTVAPVNGPSSPGRPDPLSWPQDEEQLSPGDFPDLLRGRPGPGERGGDRQPRGDRRSVIDPTSLPTPEQLQAAFEESGFSGVLSDAARPVTEDELKALMERANADRSAADPEPLDHDEISMTTGWLQSLGSAQSGALDQPLRRQPSIERNRLTPAK